MLELVVRAFRCSVGMLVASFHNAFHFPAANAFIFFKVIATVLLEWARLETPFWRGTKPDRTHLG